MGTYVDMADCSTFACDTCNIHIKEKYMHETFLSLSIRFYVQRDNIYLPARGEAKIFGVMTYRMERELERQMFNAVFKE